MQIVAPTPTIYQYHQLYIMPTMCLKQVSYHSWYASTMNQVPQTMCQEMYLNHQVSISVSTSHTIHLVPKRICWKINTNCVLWPSTITHNHLPSISASTMNQTCITTYTYQVHQPWTKFNKMNHNQNVFPYIYAISTINHVSLILLASSSTNVPIMYQLHVILWLINDLQHNHLINLSTTYLIQGIKFCSKIQSAHNHFKSNGNIGLIVTNPTQLVWVQTDVGSKRYSVLFKMTNRQKTIVLIVQSVQSI